MPATLLPFACIGAALLATLALAARFTPGAWWRRPNTRALAVLVLGTCLIGGALWWIAGPPGTLPAGAAPAAHPDAPLPGRSYRVADALNLRAANGVGARRMAVLPAGSVVTATGVVDGDWWQVRTTVDGLPFEGWASSLWLRRVDEERDERR
ncbi:SH3 domain-containing protein [Massilia niabensis]|uniref:SH3 domain-containing protein n=1 Tax=Massilia niabensis TaxID=544910 RepID=A0ABW0KZH4_9BURK